MSDNEENGNQKLPDELLAKIFDKHAEYLFDYYKVALDVRIARCYAFKELFKLCFLNKSLLAIFQSPTYPSQWFPPNPAISTVNMGLFLYLPTIPPNTLPPATDSADETSTPSTQTTSYSFGTTTYSFGTTTFSLGTAPHATPNTTTFSVGTAPHATPNTTTFSVGTAPSATPNTTTFSVGLTPPSGAILTPPSGAFLTPHTPAVEEDSEVARELFT